MSQIQSTVENEGLARIDQLAAEQAASEERRKVVDRLNRLASKRASRNLYHSLGVKLGRWRGTKAEAKTGSARLVGKTINRNTQMLCAPHGEKD